MKTIALFLMFCVLVVFPSVAVDSEAAAPADTTGPGSSTVVIIVGNLDHGAEFPVPQWPGVPDSDVSCLLKFLVWSGIRVVVR